MRVTTFKLPKHDAPAQEWIDAGLAKRSAKGQAADLRHISFVEAEAGALVYLTGEGAECLDREAKQRPPTR